MRSDPQEYTDSDFYYMPEIEPYRFVFRDGSAVTLVPDEDPIFEGGRKDLCREFEAWYFDFCPDNEEAMQYLQKNYRV